jgi:hypothetical protein
VLLHACVSSNSNLATRLQHRFKMASEPEKCPSYFKTNLMLFFNMMERHHTSTMKWKLPWIDSCLSDRLAGEGSTFWPPRSPDLTPIDFFLWGFVKDEVYVLPMPMTLNNLKDQIRTAIAKIDQPLLQNVWHEVEYWLDVCRATNGDHIELS